MLNGCTHLKRDMVFQHSRRRAVLAAMMAVLVSVQVFLVWLVSGSDDVIVTVHGLFQMALTLFGAFVVTWLYWRHRQVVVVEDGLQVGRQFLPYSAITRVEAYTVQHLIIHHNMPDKLRPVHIWTSPFSKLDMMKVRDELLALADLPPRAQSCAA